MRESDQFIDFVMMTGFSLALWSMSLFHTGADRLQRLRRPI